MAAAFTAIFTRDKQASAHGVPHTRLKPHRGKRHEEEIAMNPQDPNPATPPRPRPGEVPSPVRDVPPGRPTDPVFPPVRDPGVNPDPATPDQDDTLPPQSP